MTTRTTTTDDELLAHLADLFERVDPPPPTAVARALDALTLRAEAVLTRLITDSAHTAASPAAARTLRFAALDVVLEPTPGGLHVTGFAHTGTTVVTRWPAGARTTPLGPGGFFHVDHVPAGPLKFLLCHDGIPAIATRWFVA